MSETERAELLRLHRENSDLKLDRVLRLAGPGPVPAAIRAERIEAKVAWFHGDSDEVSPSTRRNWPGC